MAIQWTLNRGALLTLFPQRSDPTDVEGIGGMTVAFER